jgi:putative oxidoreductase
MVGLGLLVLRLTVAVVLVAHGAHELTGLFAGPGVGPGGLAATAARMNAIGLSPGLPVAVAASLIQAVCGLLVGMGLITRFAALAAAGYFGILIWKGQWHWGFYLNWVLDPARSNGIEYSVLMVAALVCLVLAGPGDWSFDGMRTRSAASRAAGRARLRNRG